MRDMFAVLNGKIDKLRYCRKIFIWVMQMVAIYCRQSVFKEESLSIEGQKNKCLEKLKREGESEEYRVYKDEGYTGANTQRPAFMRLKRDIDSGYIHKVIVYKVDRISRSLLDFVSIYGTFETHSVDFQSCSEDFDTSTAMGKATLQIIMVFAELERNMIRQRIYDNFYERGKQGLFLAGVAPYGFKKADTQINGISTKKLEIEPEQAQTVRFIYNEYRKTRSEGAVTRKLNEMGIKTNRGKHFSACSVARILRNPVYVKADAEVYDYLSSKGAVMDQPIGDYIGVYGCTVYGTRKKKNCRKFQDLTDERVQLNTHCGLITSSDWLAIQRILDKNKPISTGRAGKSTWLTGLTKCGFCGKGISCVGGQKKQKRYLNCTGRKEGHCKGRTEHMTFEQIETEVLNALKRRIMDFEFTSDKTDVSLSDEENNLKIEIAKIKEQRSRLTETFLAAAKSGNANSSLLSAVQDELNRSESILSDLQAGLENLKADGGNILSVEAARIINEEWDTLDTEDKNYIAAVFISKITVFNGVIRIEWKNHC